MEIQFTVTIQTAEPMTVEQIKQTGENLANNLNYDIENSAFIESETNYTKAFKVEHATLGEVGSYDYSWMDEGEDLES